MIRPDPIVTGRSRTLTATITVTLTATMVYPDLGAPQYDLIPNVISNSSITNSIGAFPSPSIVYGGGATAANIVAYGYTLNNAFVEMGRFNFETAAHGYGPVGTPPPNTLSTVQWGRFSWTVSGSVSITGTFAELLSIQSQLDGTLYELVPPTGTATRTVSHPAGTIVTSPVVAVADWETRNAGGGAAGPPALGIYPTGFTLNLSSASLTNVPAYYMGPDPNDPTGADVYQVGSYDIATGESVSASVTIQGITLPAYAAGYGSAVGSAGSGTLSLLKPPVGVTHTGTYSEAISPPQTIVTKCDLWDMIGAANTVPQNIQVFLKKGNTSEASSLHPFTLNNVAGTASLPLTVGGSQATYNFSDGITTYASTTNNHLKAADGVTPIIVSPHTLDGLPLPCFVHDPLVRSATVTSSSSDMRGKSSFETRPPIYGGGIRIRQKPEWTLFSAPWTIGGSTGWTGLSATVSTAGTGDIYLRIVATEAGAYASVPVPSNVIPYRFVTIRVRSVGSASLPFTFQLGGFGVMSKKTGATGADGAWVEMEMDLQRASITTETGFDGIPKKVGANLYHIGVELRLGGLQPGTYEIEWIKGKRKSETLVSVMRANPSKILSVQDDDLGQGVKPLHAATDGMITLSQALTAGGGLTIQSLSDRLNALYYDAWESEIVQAVRADKPPVAQASYGLLPADITDAETSANWLAGGGILRSGETTLDKNATTDWLTIPVQPVLRSLILYPGVGEPFTNTSGAYVPGAYGNTTTLTWQAITQGQVIGILSGGVGSSVTAKVLSGGTVDAPAGTATSTRESGYTPTLSPNAPQGSTVRVTAAGEPGEPVEWGSSAGFTSNQVIDTTAPRTYMDAKMLATIGGTQRATGRVRHWIYFVTTGRAPYGVLATDGPRQWLYVAISKRLAAYHLADAKMVFESIEHPVSEWLSLCYDTRSASLLSVGQFGPKTDNAAKVYRSRNGGQAITEVLSVTGKSFKIERDSERQHIVLLYQATDDKVMRRVSDDGGTTWSVAAQVTAAGVGLTGVVVDLEQDARASGMFYLTLGTATDPTTGAVTAAKVYRSTNIGAAWTVMLA